MATPRGDPALEALGVGHEQVVADELHAVAEPLGERTPRRPSRPRPARPRSRRSGSRPAARVQVDHLPPCRRPCRPVEVVRAVVGRARVDAGSSAIATRSRWPTRSAASRTTSIASSAKPSSGAKPPSSPTPVDMPCSCRTFLSEWKISSRDAQRFGERVRAARHDHELLHVERVLGVRAAVDDVQHRHGQDVGGAAAEPAVERDAGVRRPPPWQRRASTPRMAFAPRRRLVRRAVEPRSSARRAPRWSVGIHPSQRLGELVVDVARPLRSRPCRATRSPPSRSSTASKLPRRGARRHRRAAGRAVLERDVDLHGRIAARVEDLPRGDVGDASAAHSRPFARSKYGLARRARARRTLGPPHRRAAPPPRRVRRSAATRGAARALDRRPSRRATLTAAKRGRRPRPPAARRTVQLGARSSRELVVEIGERAVDVGVFEPDRRRALLHLARIEKRRQRLSHVVEDAFARLLSRLISSHRRRTAPAVVASASPKTWGCLRTSFACTVLQRPRDRLFPSRPGAATGSTPGRGDRRARQPASRRLLRSRRRPPRRPPRPCAGRSSARSAPGPTGTRGEAVRSVPGDRAAPRRAPRD